MLNKLNNFVARLFHHQSEARLLTKKDIERIELKLNYHFSDKQLIFQALKHRSFLSVTNEPRLESNERLELLGDAVLGMVVVEHLYRRFPDRGEGELTAIKSLVVSRKILANVALQIGLGEVVLLNQAEEKAGGRNRPSILADTFEAITGAIYLDGGLKTAVDFISDKLLSKIDEILAKDQYKNFKSMLLEFAQSRGMGVPRYVVRKEEGPDHKKIFTIDVLIRNKALGSGKGNSKKKAEQIAAKNALRRLKVF
ncbi:ribonuclease III [candidate division KSB1 bacterium 4484_87]|nr:MAG: ribonuclease III [candidate division KSB1 bacterium 4484_87]